mgnify:CR=1 FL=1
MTLDNTAVKQAAVLIDVSLASIKEKQERTLNYFTDEIIAAYAQYEEETLDAKSYLLKSQSAKIGSGFLPDDARDALELIDDACEKLSQKMEDIIADVTTNLSNISEQAKTDMEVFKTVTSKAQFVRVAEKQLSINPFAEKFSEMESKV